MNLTLGQAAIEANVSKATLSKAIKSGRMSATRQDDHSFAIDPAELFRVFPAKPKKKSEQRQTVSAASEQVAVNVENTAEFLLLKQEKETLARDVERIEQERRRERDQFEREISRLEKSVNDWQGQASAVKMIADQSTKKRGIFGLFKGS